MHKISTGLSRLQSLERYASQDSAVHRLHPLVKLFLCGLFLVLVVSFPRTELSGLSAYIFFAVVAISAADLPFGLLLKRAAVALPFSIFAGLSNLFFDREIISVVLGLPISTGLLGFASILLKTLLAATALLLLVGTTPMPELSAGLISLNVPNILVLQLTMTYRYLSVLLNEGSAMYTAYMLRAPEQRGLKLTHLGSFIGQLLLRSFGRAERVYSAMKCRGYQGANGQRTLRRPRPSELALGVLIGALLCSLRFFNLAQWIGLLAMRFYD